MYLLIIYKKHIKFINQPKNFSFPYPGFMW